MNTELSKKERGELLLKEMAAAKLNSQMKESFFSITGVTAVADMRDVESSFRDDPHFRALRALHCVHYSDMTAATKMAIPLMIQHIVEPWVGVLELSATTNRYGLPLFKTGYLTANGNPVTDIQVAEPIQTAEPQPRPKWWQRIQMLFEL